MQDLLKRILLWAFVYSFASCSERNNTEPFTEDVVYRTFGNSSGNYYVSIVPNNEIKGLIVLLPGFWALPQNFLSEIKLDSLATQNRLMMIVASPQGWGTHYFDNASIDTLDQMIKEVSQKYSLDGKKLVIGGFSIGGTGALRYAEFFSEEKSTHDLKLTGAFVVDAPLDFERGWFTMERTVKRNLHPEAVEEANCFLDLIKKHLEGSPKDYIRNYHTVSPYSATAENGGKAALLKDLPMRFYTEPDTIWWKENRGSEYKDLNAHDMDGMVGQLRVLGNKEIELITTKNKGYRKDGRRHPHAWSIVDEEELIKWVLGRIENAETN